MMVDLAELHTKRSATCILECAHIELINVLLGVLSCRHVFVGMFVIHPPAGICC